MTQLEKEQAAELAIQAIKEQMEAGTYYSPLEAELQKIQGECYDAMETMDDESDEYYELDSIANDIDYVNKDYDTQEEIEEAMEDLINRANDILKK